jgi:hypothetical protein
MKIKRPDDESRKMNANKMENGRRTKCVGGFPSSLTTSLVLTALPSIESRGCCIKSLALADVTPRFIILSNLVRGAPSSSYELGRARRRAAVLEDPSKSLWNRPRMRGLELRRLSAAPMADAERGEGVPPSPDMDRGNGTFVPVPNPMSSLSGELLRESSNPWLTLLGILPAAAGPPSPGLRVWRRIITRLVEEPDALSGLASRRSTNMFSLSFGMRPATGIGEASMLGRGRWVGLRGAPTMAIFLGEVPKRGVDELLLVSSSLKGDGCWCLGEIGGVGESRAWYASMKSSAHLPFLSCIGAGFEC